MKTCSACRESQPLEAFNKATDAPDGLMWECRTCNRARHRARIAADPEYVRRRHLRVRYGLSIEQFDALVDAQDGKCAICNCASEGALHVDHNHDCCPGQKTCGSCIRGLLCDRCNRGLGYFRDNSEWLLAASNYIKENPNVG